MRVTPPVSAWRWRSAPAGSAKPRISSRPGRLRGQPQRRRPAPGPPPPAAAGRAVWRAAGVPRRRGRPSRRGTPRRRRGRARRCSRARAASQRSAAGSVRHGVRTPQLLQLQPVLDGAQEAVAAQQRLAVGAGPRSRRRPAPAAPAGCRARAASRRPGRARVAAAAPRTRCRAARPGPRLISRSSPRARHVVDDPAAHRPDVVDRLGPLGGVPDQRRQRRRSTPAPSARSPAAGRALSSAWNSQVRAHRGSRPGGWRGSGPAGRGCPRAAARRRPARRPSPQISISRAATAVPARQVLVAGGRRR